MEEKIKWITVKGNHIPIKEGQDIGQAINEFFQDKKKYKHKGYFLKSSFDDGKDLEMEEEAYNKHSGDFDHEEMYDEWEEDESEEVFDGEEAYIPSMEYLNQKVETKINKIGNDKELTLNYLLGFSGMFNEEKLKNLSEEELKDVLIAFLNSESDEKDKADKFKQELEEFDEKYDVWSILPDNYKEFSKSIDKKINYYKEKINNNPDNYYISIWQEKLDALNELKESGFGDKWAKRARKDNRYNKLINKSKDFLNNYLNEDDIYSQKAKDEAVWLKSGKEVSEYFKDYNYDHINPDDLDKVKYYTLSYSFINEPLRKTNFYGNSEKKNMFLSHVKGITKAIDKSQFKENMWLQRGVNHLNINGLDLSNMDTNQWDNLLGTTFRDEGFLSCGTGKNTGFTHKDIIMNIYCPKGTKGLYVDKISNFMGEQETILQRGYSYRINKIYMGPNIDGEDQLFMDCEVILGTDELKYDDDKLEYIKNKYM